QPMATDEQATQAHEDLQGQASVLSFAIFDCRGGGRFYRGICEETIKRRAFHCGGSIRLPPACRCYGLAFAAATAAMAALTALLACFRGALRVILEIAATGLAAFLACFGGPLWILGEVAFTTLMLSHFRCPRVQDVMRMRIAPTVGKAHLRVSSRRFYSELL